MAKNPQEQRLEACIREHSERAWRLAMSWMRHTMDADDVVQRAFIVVANKLDQLPKGNTWPWLATIIVHEARNARRITKRRTERIELGKDREMASARDQDLLPDQNAARRETQERFLEAIDQLPDNQREAVLLTQIMGMSVREAAASLDIPSSTLDARVQQGLARLRQQLKLSDGGLVSMSSMLVLTPPPGGIEAASAAWLTVAKASLTISAVGASTSSGVIGGIVMANKAVAAASLTIALGIGIAAGVFGSDMLSDTKTTEVPTALNQPQQENPAPIAKKAPEGISTEAYQALEQELADARTTSKKYEERLDELQETLSILRDQNKALEAEIANTPTETPATQLRGKDLAVSFGSFGDQEVLREMDWDKIAEAVDVMIPLLNEYMGKVNQGEQPSPSLLMDVQKQNKILVQSAIKLSGNLPTQFQGNVNGEFTHPVMVLNTMAAHLKEAGHPFSQQQLGDLETYGAEYVESWIAKSETYTTETLSLEKVVDELELKHKVVKQVKAILTPSQHSVLYPQEIEGVHTFDIYSPIIMMIMNVELGASGKDAYEIGEDLVKLASMRWKMDQSQINSASVVLSNWAQGMESAAIDDPQLGEDTPFENFFTEDQIVASGRAQVNAMKEIVALFGQNSPIAEQMRDESVVLVAVRESN